MGCCVKNEFIFIRVEDSVEAAEANARLNKLSNCSFFVGISDRLCYENGLSVITPEKGYIRQTEEL